VHQFLPNTGSASPSPTRLTLPATRCNSTAERIENVPEQNRIEIRAAMFFTFPEDARWNAERQAVEFGVEIGEYHGVVRVPRCVFQRLLPERPTPEKCVEAYYLQRTRLETIAERKLRRRQLTEDGNVEISETSAKVPTADIHYACPNRRSRPSAVVRVRPQQRRPMPPTRRSLSARLGNVSSSRLLTLRYTGSCPG
jgi:hypothetical protein